MTQLLKQLFFLLLFGSSTAIAQQPTLPRPPGTISMGDSLFADQTEVANVHWKEFLYYIQKDSGEAYYQRMLPDTLVWAQRNLQNAQTSSVTLTKEYFSDPRYNSFPVVGISHEQAQAYARWRSAVVSQLLSKPENLQRLGLQNKKIVVEYRLPTEEEWMATASAGLPLDKYPYGHKKYLKRQPGLFDAEQVHKQLEEPKPPLKTFKKLLRQHKLPLFNVVAGLPGNVLVAAEFTEPVAGEPANTLGLHHIIGNVAEMTAMPGIAKGGSFMHTLANSNIIARQTYYGPAPWLGLRLVATVRVAEESKKPKEGR